MKLKMTKRQQAVWDEMWAAFYKMQEAMHETMDNYKDGRLPTLDQIAACEDLQRAYDAARARWDLIERNTELALG